MQEEKKEKIRHLLNGLKLTLIKFRFGGHVDKALWTFPHFKPSEFDSPDKKDSGYEMDYNFMSWIESLRICLGKPIVITSGYRTKEHNNNLLKSGYEASVNSSHMKGIACDIMIPDSNYRYLLIKCAMELDCKRIGIGTNFVHLDLDTKKSQEIVWLYSRS